MTATSLITAHAQLETLATADRNAVVQLATAGGRESLLVEVPLMRDDVHDVSRLVGLERYLLA
jgi:hypothetical protein